jgi:CRISPR-associated protein Cst2
MTLYTLSLCGRMTLDLHNLNNEGTEGNQQLTRMVSVVVNDNRRPVVRTVNAISGDMFKHIQSEHLHKLALEQHANNATTFPLSKGAKDFDTNRINSAADILNLVRQTQQEPGISSTDKKGLQKILDKLEKAGHGEEDDETENDTKETAQQEKGKGTIPNARLINRLLQSCAVTDVMGTLITSGGLSLPRKSCIEFGWVVGVPDLTKSDSLFHVKYDPRGRGEGAGTEENTGQTIFHRPLNSGVYAVVAHAELFRVGRNDVTLDYVVDAPQRLLRAKALLQSLWYIFVKISGAQRNTQHPHVLNFEGAITTSAQSSVPAPTASPLSDGYLEDIEGMTQALNRLLSAKAVEVKRFASQAEFGNKMADLIEDLQVPN